MQRQTLGNEMQADITKTYNQLCSLATTEAGLKEMIDNASEQYIKRNITLLEFVDLYDSYKETAMNIIDMKEKLAQTANELNREVGKEIIKL